MGIPPARSVPLTSQIHEVIVLQPVDGLELAPHIEILCGIEEVMDCGVLLVSSKDLLGFERSGNKEWAR